MRKQASFFDGTNIEYLAEPEGYSELEIEIIKALYDLPVSDEVIQFLAECGKQLSINAILMQRVFCGGSSIRGNFESLFSLRFDTGSLYSPRAILLARGRHEFEEYILDQQGAQAVVLLGPQNIDSIEEIGPRIESVGFLHDYFEIRCQTTKVNLGKYPALYRDRIRPNLSGMLKIDKATELDFLDIKRPQELLEPEHNTVLAKYDCFSTKGAGFNAEELHWIEQLYKIHANGQLKIVLEHCGRSLVGVKADSSLTLFSDSLVMKHHLFIAIEMHYVFEDGIWEGYSIDRTDGEKSLDEGIFVVGKEGEKRYVIRTLSTKPDEVFVYDLEQKKVESLGLSLLDFIAARLKPDASSVLHTCLLTVTRDQALIQKFQH